MLIKNTTANLMKLTQKDIRLALMVALILLQNLMLLNQSVEIYASIFNVSVTKNH